MAEALALHREGASAPKLTLDEVRCRLRERDAALIQLKGEEQSAMTVQVAGVRAGASPSAYAAVFADIAARRKTLQQDLQASLAQPALRSRKKLPSEAAKMEAGLLALEQAWRVLNSPDVEGHVKRDLLLTVIEKVICQKDGAEVVFLPGLFGETEEKKDTGEPTERTLYTTCMGISTQR